jgi:hypothetical protein
MVVPLVKAPRTVARSVAAAAGDQRSVRMRGVDRQLHPRIPRFGSRFILSPASTPIAITAGADSVTSLTAASPATRQRRLVTTIGAHSSTRFTVQDSRSSRHPKFGRCRARTENRALDQRRSVALDSRESSSSRTSRRVQQSDKYQGEFRGLPDAYKATPCVHPLAHHW